MEPTVTPRCFALLLADCLAPPLPAQEDDIEENRAALLKNAPPVSPKGKVTATRGLFSAGARRRPAVPAKLAADPKSTNENLKRLWLGCGRRHPGLEGVQK